MVQDYDNYFIKKKSCYIDFNFSKLQQKVVLEFRAK